MGLPNTFIVGGSKSGTSTLQKILNDHSQIYGLPYESHFLADIFLMRILVHLVIRHLLILHQNIK